MKCGNCSAENIANAKFCAKCGAPLEKNKEINNQDGYSELEEHYPRLFNESQKAFSYIEEKPYLVVDRVNTILETLCRKYYFDAIVNQRQFDVSDLYDPAKEVRVKKAFFDMIVELNNQGFISDEDAELLKKINGTRNDIEYHGKGGEIKVSFAKYVYSSGKKLSKMLADAIDNQPISRYTTLKVNYPDLYRSAQDAQYVLKKNDALGAVQTLGKILRALCVDLCAAYCSLPDGQRPEYSEAIVFLGFYDIINENSQKIIKDIIGKRNTHHNLQTEISIDYATNALDVTGKIVVYLLDRINEVPNNIQQIIESNKSEYQKIMENIISNTGHLEDESLKTVALKISYYSMDCKTSFTVLNQIKQNKTMIRKSLYYFLFDNYQKELTLNTKLEWLYTFEDFWQETYPNISILKSFSEDGFFVTITFDLPQLKNEPEIKQLLEIRGQERIRREHIRILWMIFRIFLPVVYCGWQIVLPLLRFFSIFQRKAGDQLSFNISSVFNLYYYYPEEYRLFVVLNTAAIIVMFFFINGKKMRVQPIIGAIVLSIIGLFNSGNVVGFIVLILMNIWIVVEWIILPRRHYR